MKTLVVSHSESGSYQLAHWLKHNVKRSECEFLLSKQGAKAFKRVHPGIKPIDSRTVNFELLHLKYERMISSSSLDNFEKLAFVRAINNDMQTEVMLDHWDNYEGRLTLSGKLLVPDILYVCDEEAERRAQDIPFPDNTNVRIERVRNYYADSVAADIGDLSRCFYRESHATHILFVSEPPVSEAYDSIELLRRTLIYFIGRLKTRKKESYVVRIRIVDYRMRNKILGVIAEMERFIDVALTEVSSLAEDCAWADMVVGCCDASLAIAAESGKKVYSVLPSALAEHRLPFDSIKMLFKPSPKTPANY